jgi:hypothetical protein
MARVLPASDVDRARRFYRVRLGLAPRIDGDEGLIYEVGKASVSLLYRQLVRPADSIRGRPSSSTAWTRSWPS